MPFELPAALMERHTQHGQLDCEHAHADAEDQSALQKIRQCREFFGEWQRMPHRQHQNVGAEPHSPSYDSGLALQWQLFKWLIIARFLHAFQDQFAVHRCI